VLNNKIKKEKDVADRLCWLYVSKVPARPNLVTGKGKALKEYGDIICTHENMTG